jgi:hypothetical protein
MSQRRLVRVAPSFFDRLDELLPGERTAGQPSATDFLLHELPRIMDRLAQDTSPSPSPSRRGRGYRC